MGKISFADLLNGFIHRERISHTELGEKLGERLGRPAISRNTISAWVNGRIPQTRQMVEALAEVLHLEEEDRSKLLEAYSSKLLEAYRGRLPDESTEETPISTMSSPELEFSSAGSAYPHQQKRLSIEDQQKRLSIEEQNRKRMLQRLRRTYEDVFTQSLAGVTPIELGLANKPDAVQNAATILFQTSARPEQLLPPGTSILYVYDEATHELLILGAPGAGKSTLLVELARQLVRRAEIDETHPLPVVLPLSSWAIKRSSLDIWLTEQVAQVYDIPKATAQRWISEGELLPLLDGLDEMEEEARPACIAAINAYHHEHLRLPLVICSRQTEYEATAQRQRIALQNAVVIQPLKHEQVEQYLVQGDKSLSALRHTLAANPALAEMATTPLMLHILILTYQGAEVRQLSTQSDQLLQQVWTDYLARMVERKGNALPYPLELTRSWLQWLAQQMRIHNQTVFYLEHIQSDWLAPKLQRVYYWLGVSLPGALIGGLVSTLVGQFFLSNLDMLKGPGWLLIVILGGVLGSLLCPKVQDEPGYQQGADSQTWRRISLALVVSFMCGTFIGFVQGQGFDPTWQMWLTDGGTYGLFFGLCCFLLMWRLPVLVRRTSARTSAGPHWWQRSSAIFHSLHLWRSCFIGMVTAVSFWFSATWSQDVSSQSNILKAALVFGLVFFLTSCLLGVIFHLKSMQAGVYLAEQIAWTWRGLYARLFAPTHLARMCMLTGGLTALIGLVYLLSQRIEQVGALPVTPQSKNTASLFFSVSGSDLVYSVSFSLSFGLSIGLLWWFLLGFYQSINPQQIKPEMRQQPNEGIHRTLGNCLKLGGLIGMVISILELFTLSIGYGLDFGLYYQQWNFGFNGGLHIGWSLFCATLLESGLLFCLIAGGLSIWQHYLMRYLLARAQLFPWSAVSFLEEARARTFLRRQGGGYDFIHGLFRDYLADTPISSSQENLPCETTPVVSFQLNRKPRLRVPILAALLLLVLLLSVFGGVLYAQQQSVLVRNPYPVPGMRSTLAFFDAMNQELSSKWSSKLVSYNGTCQFLDEAFHIRQPQMGYYTTCYWSRTVTNFVFEVQLMIIQGGCGGTVLRDDGYGRFYFFRICADGTYTVRKYRKYGTEGMSPIYHGRSQAIRTGLGQRNTLAVVANGSVWMFYINRQLVYQMHDASYTAGMIALLADNLTWPVTEVAYTNARLWVLLADS